MNLLSHFFLTSQQIQSMKFLIFELVSQVNNPKEQQKIKIKDAIQALCELRNKIIFAFDNFQKSQITQINWRIVLYDRFCKVMIQKMSWQFSNKKFQSSLIFKWKYDIQKRSHETHLLQQELEFCKFNLGLMHLIRSSNESHTQKQHIESLKSCKISIYYLTNALTYYKDHQINIIDKSLFLIKVFQLIARGIYYKNVCRMFNFRQSFQYCKQQAVCSAQAYKYFNQCYEQLCKAFTTRSSLKITQNQITHLLGFVYINRALSQSKSYQKFATNHEMIFEQDKVKNISQIQSIVGYLKQGKAMLQADLQCQNAKKYLNLKQAQQDYDQLKRSLRWFDGQLNLYQKRNESYGTKKNISQSKISILDKQIQQKYKLTQQIPNSIKQFKQDSKQYLEYQRRLQGIYLIDQINQKSFIQKQKSQTFIGSQKSIANSNISKQVLCDFCNLI